MSFVPRLSRLATLDARDWALLAAATTLVVTVRAALWLLPSGRIVRAVRRLTSAPVRPMPAARTVPAARVVWAVEAASRRVPRASCLTQAVAAHLLLRVHGWTSQLCLGVAREGESGFRAHAWLERDGRIVIGGEEARLLTRLPDLAGTGGAR